MRGIWKEKEDKERGRHLRITTSRGTSIAYEREDKVVLVTYINKLASDNNMRLDLFECLLGDV